MTLSAPLRVMHMHFGHDGGAERFFVHLTNGLAKRGVEQKTFLRPGRVWRQMIDASNDIVEDHFRSLSLARFTLPPKVRQVADRWNPDAMMAWVPKGCKLMLPRENCVRVLRLGDYPSSLKKFGNADVIVANTPDIVTCVKSLGWSQESRMISNFTSRETVEPVPRSEFDTPEDARLLVSTGRFVEHKAFDVLIHATAKAPNMYFWLIGDGDEAPALRTLVDKLGVQDRVRFLGWKADARPYIAAADAFGMSSRFEPLGNVVLEAWAQDIPVISTKAEGPRWFMKHRQNGLVIDIDDVDGVAKAMDDICSDPALRADLIAGGREALDGMFSEEAIVGQYMHLFARHRPNPEALVAEHLDHTRLVGHEIAH